MMQPIVSRLTVDCRKDDKVTANAPHGPPVRRWQIRPHHEIQLLADTDLQAATRRMAPRDITSTAAALATPSIRVHMKRFGLRSPLWRPLPPSARV